MLILIRCVKSGRKHTILNYIYPFAFCSHSWYVCMVGCESSGGRREIPGIRFGMASNDGSWFAAFRRGTPPGASRVVIYTRYIPRTRLGLLQGFRVTYVATWREKTIFEDISSSSVVSVESDVRTMSFSPRTATERILKSRLNDFHGTSEAKRNSWQSRRNGKNGCPLYIHRLGYYFTTLFFFFFFFNLVDAYSQYKYDVCHFVKQSDCNLQ